MNQGCNIRTASERRCRLCGACLSVYNSNPYKVKGKDTCDPCGVAHQRKEDESKLVRQHLGSKTAMKAMFGLGRMNAEQLADAACVSYNHAYKFLNKQTDRGLLRRIDGVKPAVWELTEKGRQLIEKT